LAKDDLMVSQALFAQPILSRSHRRCEWRLVYT
jgi:hypothetical protein